MIYLTFNDLPSGVYISQVIDVVKLIKEELGANIKLFAFVSVRNFLCNREIIKNYLPDAVVVPMAPKLRNWVFNRFTLLFLSYIVDTSVVIARGVFACNLALFLKKKGRTGFVCYDGRGAITAEHEEYPVSNDKRVNRQIALLESKAVNDSDFRIAISNKLVSYWKERFKYNKTHHSLIPCTLGREFNFLNPDEIYEIRTRMRRELGFNDTDIVLTYAGSTAGWQSFSLLNRFLQSVLKNGKKYKVFFLSGNDKCIDKLSGEFPTQVKQMWVEHNKVQNYLYTCDYGLLIREKTVTNKVASPTKFAEYLSAGLRIIISSEIGDFSQFVIKNNCGLVLDETLPEAMYDLPEVSIEERFKTINLAKLYFYKKSEINIRKYIDLLKSIKSGLVNCTTY